MINGLVAHVELEHEIVKWTCSITNSLALICNTVHKRFSVASNDTVVRTNGEALREIAQRNVEWYSVHTNSVALREMAQRDVEWYSVHTNGVELPQLRIALHSFAIQYTNGVALRQMVQGNVE
ncbi:hypothetical protein pdam_00022573 [Pocillopora damicornis]|uniref:Uncharacterized protein n=1 Tax=Pocillopora damicornis TaxID=46731 RepID=A0A3M6UGI8_POCDA|nr:hypothetical protein pdam_00022573 [Pocillopora damicornis]